jgi:preprotein translocase subunit SecE
MRITLPKKPSFKQPVYPMKLFQFYRQVVQETKKVTWPTRRETLITALMVLILCTLAALFFFLADQLFAYVIGLIVG